MSMRRTFFVVGVLVGCGAETSRSPEEQEPQTGAVEQGLGLDQGCETLPPNASIVGNGDAVSPLSYGANSCRFGYLVDLRAYSWSGVPPGKTVVSWDGPLPNSALACSTARLQVYVWEYPALLQGAGGTIPGWMIYRGSSNVLGTWNGSQCVIQPIQLLSGSMMGPTAGRWYRYAVSAPLLGVTSPVRVHVQ
jgi:hypothetical protein